MTAVNLLQESRFLSAFIEYYLSAALLTCNFHCHMTLQSCISDVQIAVCRLHYALLQCNIQDLKVALSKLHYTLFQRRNGGLQFALYK